MSDWPDLNALRRVPSVSDMVLVAARVRDFRALGASLPADQRPVLVEQIVRRLELGSGGATLYRGDEGVFAWLMPHAALGRTSDVFDAMQAVFRDAVAVGEQRVDVTIAFGLDADGRQSLFDRLRGAMMAADASLPANPAAPPTHLGAAIDSGAIWVAYQPKVDLRSNRIVGCEALARWTHPDQGPISPADFIPAAERQRGIARLTYHVLAHAIRTAAEINQAGVRFGVAVNLSARMFDDPCLAPEVGRLLVAHGLPPELLTLEIAEKAALSGSDWSVALRAIGVRLSIDDYGTGFSDLDDMRRFPVSEIKIDRSFIEAIDRSRSDAALVRATIRMAHALGRSVVAEGVERPDTLERLRAMGCDLVQGYLTGRPMAASELCRCVMDERRQAA